MSARWIPFALVLAACGARSGIDLGSEPDAGLRLVECVHDSECDDGFDCTLDFCAYDGVCVVRPRDELCEDGNFCNGPAFCAMGVGCVEAPPSCDDGIACTVDTCDETLDACTSEPRADLCPLSHRCDPVLGCVARALVHDARQLWEVDLPSGETRALARIEIELTDIALHPDGRLFAVDHASLFVVDEETGLVSRITGVGDALNSLEVGPDGALYGAGARTVVRLDPASGAVETVATFPPGWSASGDVAFVGGRLFVTGTSSRFSRVAPNALFDATGGGVAVNVGMIGAPCVWGLAPFGETLYGFTCDGALLRIDVATGAGTRLAGIDVGVNGAASR